MTTYNALPLRSGWHALCFIDVRVKSLLGKTCTLAALFWALPGIGAAAVPTDVKNESDVAVLLEKAAASNPVGAYEVLKKVQVLLAGIRVRCDAYFALSSPSHRQDEAILRDIHLLLNSIENAYLVNRRWMPNPLRLFVFKKINSTRRDLDRVSFYVRNPKFESAEAQKKYYLSYVRNRARDAEWVSLGLEPGLYLLKAVGQ